MLIFSELPSSLRESTSTTWTVFFFRLAAACFQFGRRLEREFEAVGEVIEPGHFDFGVVVAVDCYFVFDADWRSGSWGVWGWCFFQNENC